MDFIKILKIDLKNIFSNPAWLFMNTIFPFVMTLILSYLMESDYGNSVRSIDYFAITSLVFTCANAAVMAANTFLEDRIKRANLRIMYSPVSKLSMTLTKVVATFIYVAFWVLVLGVIFSFVFDVNFGNYKVWILYVSLTFVSSSIGVMFAAIFKSEETANSIVSTFISLMAILGGTFFTIPKSFHKISNVSFMKWVNDACFSIIYDEKVFRILPILIGLIIVSFVCIIVTNIVFKEEDYL